MAVNRRIPLLPPEKWGKEELAAFKIMESEATAATGAASNASMTLANHPRLAAATFALGRHLLLESTLPHRLRELVTLRISWRLKSEYEWHHHVRFIKTLGATDAEIDAVKLGPDATNWTPQERAALRLADELRDDGRVTDATWNELCKTLDRHQMMDLVFTVGQYVMLAWSFEALQIEIEPGLIQKEHPLS
jgi:4-carboxymuconolactone decarboxylase